MHVYKTCLSSVPGTGGVWKDAEKKLIAGGGGRPGERKSPGETVVLRKFVRICRWKRGTSSDRADGHIRRANKLAHLSLLGR